MEFKDFLLTVNLPHFKLNHLAYQFCEAIDKNSLQNYIITHRRAGTTTLLYLYIAWKVIYANINSNMLYVTYSLLDCKYKANELGIILGTIISQDDKIINCRYNNSSKILTISYNNISTNVFFSTLPNMRGYNNITDILYDSPILEYTKSNEYLICNSLSDYSISKHILFQVGFYKDPYPFENDINNLYISPFYLNSKNLIREQKRIINTEGITQYFLKYLCTRKGI